MGRTYTTGCTWGGWSLFQFLLFFLFPTVGAAKVLQEMSFFSRIVKGHQRLKERIHATRIPLGRSGQVAMGLFYFFSPLVAGYFIMQWTNGIAERNTGVYRDGSIGPEVRRRAGIGRTAETGHRGRRGRGKGGWVCWMAV
jgi:hypothetical protein